MGPTIRALPSTLAYRQDPGIADGFDDNVEDMLTAGIKTEDDSAILHPTKWAGNAASIDPSTINI